MGWIGKIQPTLRDFTDGYENYFGFFWVNSPQTIQRWKEDLITLAIICYQRRQWFRRLRPR